MTISSDVNLETDRFVKLGWKGYRGNLFQEIMKIWKQSLEIYVSIYLTHLLPSSRFHLYGNSIASLLNKPDKNDLK